MVHAYKKESFQSWITLAVILIIGISLRLYHLDSYSIFFDEKSTMVVSQGIVLEELTRKKFFQRVS